MSCTGCKWLDTKNICTRLQSSEPVKCQFFRHKQGQRVK